MPASREVAIHEWRVRTRASWIADRIDWRLRHGGGVERVDVLLARTGHGPEHWEQMAAWEHAAEKMALRTLARDPRVVPILGGRVVVFCSWNRKGEVS